MLFGSLSSFCPIPGMIFGRTVADTSFLRALIKYGTFSEYHFFLGDDRDVSIFMEIYGDLIQSNPQGRIKVFNRNKLAPLLKENEYTVFHQSDICIGDICHTVSQYSPQRFPVTGITHSISYQSFMMEYLKWGILDVRPYDSLICTSSQGEAVIRNIITDMKSRARDDYSINMNFKVNLYRIPLGIDCSDFPKIPKGDARQACGLPKDGIIILSLGRFSKISKMDLSPIILMFRELLNELNRDDIYLLLAGSAVEEPDYVNSLASLAMDAGISRNVIIRKDNFDNRTKSLLFASSDIFISPSDNLQETFGISIIEAMAAGLPVVAADIDGYKDTIIHGKNGFRVPCYWADCTDDISSLSPISYEGISHLQISQSIALDLPVFIKYLAELIKNEELRLSMGQNSRNMAEDIYDWSRIIPQYESLWKTLYGESKKYPAPKPAANLFELNYFNIFSHYPTRLIRDNDILKATDFGKSIMQAKTKYGICDAVMDISDTQIMAGILINAKEGISVGELIEKLSKAGKDRKHITYHIMWMLKHNFIQLSAAPG